MPATLSAVTHALKCIGCTTILRGLPITGKCPECGTPVMSTLVETLDMPSQSLVQLRHPRRVGRGLLTVGAGVLLWTASTTAPAVGRALAELIAGHAANDSLADHLGVSLAFVGAALIAIGSIQLSRRDDPILVAESGNAGRWLMAGVGIWLLGSTAILVATVGGAERFVRISTDGITFAALAVQLLGSAIAAIGVRTFVTVLGGRCRRFRHAGTARQSIETMVIAGAITLVCSLASTVVLGLGHHDLSLVLRVIAFITGGLLLMGAGYLVVNFGWIRQRLIAPPPSLESVVRVIGLDSPAESSN